MDQAVHPVELTGPWRRAALVATGIAAAEFLVLIGIGVVVLAPPIMHSVRAHATAHPAASAAKHATTTTTAAAHPAPKPAASRHARKPAAAPSLPRSRTRVLVLNGNGRQGAAAAEAAALSGHGYRISATANAQRNDYATSIVMYRPGFEPEARRLARDVHIRVVAPLDGLRVSGLKGAHLVLVVGR